MFEIKKGKPAKKAVIRKSKYHFEKMTPGTYIEVPSKLVTVTSNGRKRCSVVSTAHNFGKRHGFKFVSEQQDTGTIRIYRVK